MRLFINGNSCFAAIELRRQYSTRMTNGNLTSDGTRNFGYDDENRLVSVWVANEWANSFFYDGLQRKRIEKQYTWNGGWVETNEIHFRVCSRICG